MSLDSFITRWRKSGAAERSNKDSFLNEFCDAIGVERPHPATGFRDRDLYCFEKDVVIRRDGKPASVGKVDLYKDGCFILEAKQGSEKGSPKVGTARRGTYAWNIAMHDAFGEALGYAQWIERPPPFIIACDIGLCFDIYSRFDGSIYRPYPDTLRHRVFLADLPAWLPTFQAIFNDPMSLDPSRRATEVTTEVATKLANLARELEGAGHDPALVSKFLMRCVFTMFAQSVGLLEDLPFTTALTERWLKEPSDFASGVTNFWRAMNRGESFGYFKKLLRFNGGLFKDAKGLPLTKVQLELLLEAAKCSWSDVEPAIFGTLLEQALDEQTRHSLGAHFTPRPYVERLVRHTIEEPLREEWQIVQAEARRLVQMNHLAKARDVVRAFNGRLCALRVLDPACGTGNFLYVALDLFNRIEAEVEKFMLDLGKGQAELPLQEVKPSQFLGIEVNPRAKEIAELVLWIGYLQDRRRRNITPREPVLEDYQNVEGRDALLAGGRRRKRLDAKGREITHWDGTTMMISPVTGRLVPDEDARVPEYEYVGARAAPWPAADFIVGNPPFIGNKRMRAALGDGYVEALRATYDDVPETADYVMYWWSKAASLLRRATTRRFGFITTNSITQTFNRRVVREHLRNPEPVSLAFAIPDHPWVDASSGAAVRIAMTVACPGTADGTVQHVTEDGEGVMVARQDVGVIHDDLRVGADVTSTRPLRANADMSFQGVIPLGAGFRLSPADLVRLRFDSADLPDVVRPFVIGRDLVQRPESRFVIDLLGLSEAEARASFPALFQHLLVHVKPERDQNRRETRRLNWWLFGENAPKMRRALRGLRRYIATVETSKYKPFVFLDGTVLPDHKVYAIASDDAFLLGVLSSRVHGTWALAAGGTLEDRPTWTNTTCFLPFPFPDCGAEQKTRIRSLAESVDQHRKRQQATHRDLTLTAVYNVLEKLRAGQPLDAKEQVVHEHGLASILRKLHDELDAAVLDAYGWPRDVADEDLLGRLVELNAERVREEEAGSIRWLRPEFQNQNERRETVEPRVAVPSSKPPPPLQPWPSELPAQIAAVLALVSRRRTRSLEEIAASFTGATADDIQPLLDSLRRVGLALELDDASWIGVDRLARGRPAADVAVPSTRPALAKAKAKTSAPKRKKQPA